MDENCIFCKIIAGDIPATKVYEDKCVLAFMDINPATRGHTLVIPKEHVPYIWEASSDVMANVGSVLPKISQAVKNAFKAEAINIFNLNGTLAGQSVFHVHFHIIPRYEGDGLLDMNVNGSGEIIFKLKPKTASPEELKENAEKIRKCLEA